MKLLTWVWNHFLNIRLSFHIHIHPADWSKSWFWKEDFISIGFLCFIIEFEYTLEPDFCDEIPFSIYYDAKPDRARTLWEELQQIFKRNSR